MIFAQQRTLTSITLQNSWRWDPRPASWHDLNTRSQIWDIFHNRQSEPVHKMEKNTNNIWAKCFKISIAAITVGHHDRSWRFGHLSTDARDRSYPDSVFNVRILILWHILCLTLPPICRDGGSRELRHGRTRQLLRPGQDLINSVSIFTSKNITTHEILDFILVSQHSSVLHILKTFYLQIYRCHSNIRDKWCSRCVHLLLGWLV